MEREWERESERERFGFPQMEYVGYLDFLIHNSICFTDN